MIVDCAVYDAGKRRPEDYTIEEAAAAISGDSFAWIGLYEPTSEEFERIRQQFDIHELAAEDAVAAHQRPKLELFEDTLLMVLKTARYLDVEEEIEFGEIIVLAGSDFVVVVRHGEASALIQVRRYLEERPATLAIGPSAVLHAIVDRVVDDYTPVVRGLEGDVAEVEKQVFSTGDENPVERIYFLKREVLEFQLAASALAEPLDRLYRGRIPVIDDEMHEYFRDVHDHLVRVASQIEQYRDMLTSALDANLTQVTIRQNEDMRRISAWVAVAVVPTLIAGIFGMNFSRMPGVDAAWGFWVVMGIMGAVAGFLYRAFRRSGWL